MSGCNHNSYKKEIQLTHDFSYNHDLDNNDNFSPDDQWLVYDTRTEEGGIGANGIIEKVHVKTGEKKILYQTKEQTPYGPGVGAASYSHTENQVIFIHGLNNCSPERPYEQWRRTGVIVRDNAPNKPVFMDARDSSPPFTPGALRGGTHRHEFSGDGGWIGFTYNDALLKKMEDETGIPYNLRTIGVSKMSSPVLVTPSIPEEDFSGEWFSVLVVKVVPHPVPGSNEISRAAGDSWIGNAGYKNKEGHLQRARAFIGTVKNKNGEEVDEVFVVDIPEDISLPSNTPLEGTATTMPSPPKGTQQRRLSFTTESKFPGCEGIVRSSFDGSMLAFIARDQQGAKQVFTISPLGGTPTQQTFHPTDVTGGIRWHPKEKSLVYIWQNALVHLRVGAKEGQVLTHPSFFPLSNPVWSHDGKTLAFNRSIPNKEGVPKKQIFVLQL